MLPAEQVRLTIRVKDAQARRNAASHLHGQFDKARQHFAGRVRQATSEIKHGLLFSLAIGSL